MGVPSFWDMDVVEGIMKFAFVGTVLTLALTACETPNPYTMNPTATQSEAHIREFAGVGEIEDGAWKIFSKQGSFRAALKESSGAPSNSALATNYLDTGVTVADLYCQVYFKKLSVQHADQVAGRGALNIADAAVSALLGLTGTGANTIAGASVLFSATEAQYENIDAAYLVSPNISSVERLVTDARQTLYREILSDDGPKSYAQAERRLNAYHKLCTFTGVNRLVDEAVAAGKPIIRSSSQTQARSRLNSTAARAQLDSLTDELAIPGTAWGYEQAAWLYAFYFLERKTGDGVIEAIEKVFDSVLDTADGQTTEAYLLSKAAVARRLLLEIDRATPLETNALRLTKGARDNKQLLDSAVAARDAVCPPAGKPADAARIATRDSIRAQIEPTLGKAKTDQLFTCPPASPALQAVKVELQSPKISEQKNH